MEKKTDIQFKVFDWLRFPLIVGVVFIHSFGKPFDYNALDFAHLSGMDYYNLFRISISHVLTHVCVPTFYLISGYLFFVSLEKWNWKKYLTKLKKRCKTLLIPFLLWNTVCVLIALYGAFRHEGWTAVYGFLDNNNYLHLYWDCKTWNQDRTNWLGLANVATSPYLVPLWFLRDLMVVNICAPIIYFLLKRLKVLFMVLLAGCFVSGVFVNIPGFSATAFLFYSMGSYCRLSNINKIHFEKHNRLVLYLLTIILWLLCTVFDGHNTPQGDIIYPFFVFLGCLTLLNISYTIVEKGRIKIPAFFSKSSFFIYLIHKIAVLNFIQGLAVLIFGESNPILLTVSYIFVPIATVALCMFLFILLNKISPSICSVLTGNR